MRPPKEVIRHPLSAKVTQLAEPITTRTLGGVAIIGTGTVLIVATASQTRPEAKARAEPAVEREELAA